MNIERDIAVLIRSYEKFIFPLRAPSVVVEKLSQKYPIVQIHFLDMDIVAQEVFPTINDETVFRVERAKQTESFFQDVARRFGEDVGVYIFLKNGNLYSNCRALELEMAILQGISEEDVQKKTSLYYHYLIQFHFFEQITHTKWEDFYF